MEFLRILWFGKIKIGIYKVNFFCHSMIMISSAGFFGKKTMGNLPRNGEIICKKIIKLLKLGNERFERSLV